MRIARYRLGRRTGYGVVEGDRLFALQGSVFESPRRGAQIAPMSEVRLLSPVQPSKILALGRNYLEHAREMESDVPTEPLIFLKATSSLNAHESPIVAPAWAGQIDHEGELVVVIGKKAKNVSEAEALDVVLGYTCGNDVTARTIQRKDVQWTRGKSFDTFACLGPTIETGILPDGRDIECRVNGQVRQKSNTDKLIFNVPYMISFLSHFLTLLPGDVIFSGTPAGIGPIKPGDRVEVEIQGVGVLSNPVVGAP